MTDIIRPTLRDIGNSILELLPIFFPPNPQLKKEGIMARSLNAAAENKKTKFAEVERSGEKILIPEDMTITESIRILQAKEKEEEQEVQLDENFNVFFLEGAYALANTLDKLYGWFQQMATPGFFGPTPPAMISVDVDFEKTVQVPWGRFSVPGIPANDGSFSTSYTLQPDGMITFRLTALLKKKHSKQFHDLCAAVRAELKSFSLYRGKAITIKFSDNTGKRLDYPKPEFSRLSKLDEKEIIFSDDVAASIKANLYTPIEKTALVKEQGIPLRRGILLAGPYGVGKTLVATLTQAKAIANGWTYVYCQKASEFPEVVKFAQQYQPCVVFCEDIDRVTQGDRSTEMDAILNTIDGVDSKNAEIILVLTTNELEKIHQAMLRPGRLDAVINVKRPDAKAVERLLRSYSKGLLPVDASLTLIGKKLAGNTPAVIREVVERSKLAAISIMEEGDEMSLSEEAFLISANTMNDQLTLLEKKQVIDPKPIEVLGTLLGKAVVDASRMAIKHHAELTGYAKQIQLEGNREEEGSDASIVKALNLSGATTQG